MADPAPPFGDLYGRMPETTADAPGRVNLIGEHTDYNGGYVLPTAIPQRTRVELARCEDRRVRAYSANIGGAPRSYGLGEERRGGDWLDYVAGVTATLTSVGHDIGGFDLRIASEVPLGSGLSSSAALEVALLRGLRAVFGLALNDVELALLAHRVETGFVGAPVGVMDQMACSLADETAALFLDTRSLACERVHLPDDGELAVISSGVAHRNVGGGYAERRSECTHAAELLGVPLLRDLSPEALERLPTLPEPLDRRARHVLSENERVLETVAALRAGDLARVGVLLDASHASLRDDFQVSLPEIDLLVELAQAEPTVYGARLTGGGFGGSIVVLAHRGSACSVAERIAAHYAERSGCTPTVLVPRSAP